MDDDLRQTLGRIEGLLEGLPCNERLADIHAVNGRLRQTEQTLAAIKPLSQLFWKVVTALAVMAALVAWAWAWAKRNGGAP